MNRRLVGTLMALALTALLIPGGLSGRAAGQVPPSAGPQTDQPRVETKTVAANPDKVVADAKALAQRIDNFVYARRSEQNSLSVNTHNALSPSLREANWPSPLAFLLVSTHQDRHLLDA